MRTALLAPSLRLFLGLAVVAASAITLSGCGDSAPSTKTQAGAPEDTDAASRTKAMEDFMAKGKTAKK